MRKFVKPTKSVYLPKENRMMLPEGESVEVDGYIERLILSGRLKVVDVSMPKASAEKIEQEKENEE